MREPKQKQRIVKYMRDTGEMTALDAVREFGIMQFATRINELEKQGYVFKKVSRSSQNRYGEKVHFKVYSLVKEGEQI